VAAVVVAVARHLDERNNLVWLQGLWAAEFKVIWPGPHWAMGQERTRSEVEQRLCSIVR
jgi:hypothetical protein